MRLKIKGLKLINIKNDIKKLLTLYIKYNNIKFINYNIQ